jgi:DNA-binding NtrC family response regulator
MIPRRRRVLFVDDDPTFRRVMAREIEGFGYEAEVVGSAEDALASLARRRPDVAVFDLRLPGEDGLDLLRRVQDTEPDLPVLMLTGHGGVPEAVQAMRLGAYDFLTKPVSLDVMESALARALERRDLVAENRRLRRLAAGEESRTGILGDAPVTVALRGLVERIAASAASVLVLGEHGTGKELVARAVHELSARAGRPFVAVNMGAIPEALIESELFGHARGAFTGAGQPRVGLFEAAHGGTLFLDEIAELPLSMQPVLLRVLQSGELRPIGGTETIEVDVRVVAATNRDLQAEVAAGRFREDLYYRIATLVVEVPPLRLRCADIVVLATQFLEEERRKGDAPLGFAVDALDALAQHAWPGNVRELQNAVARLAVLTDSPEIQRADVEAHVFARASASRGGALPTLDLGELEELAVRAALARHAGNKRAAAAELGVALKTLYNKLARLRDTETGESGR